MAILTYLIIIALITHHKICGGIDLISTGSQEEFTELEIRDAEIITEYDVSEFLLINSTDSTAEFSLIGNSTKNLSFHALYTSGQPFYTRWDTYGPGQLFHNYNLSNSDDKEYSSATYFNLTNSNPVVRIERTDGWSFEHSTHFNIYVYTGEGQPPYLYKDAILIKPYMLNATHLVFPCILNYPLGSITPHKLQLWKGHEQLSLVEMNITYQPELGFIKPVSQEVSNLFGEYKCLVSNSTKDYINLKVDEGSLIYFQHLYIERGRHYNYWEGEDYEFLCQVPKALFKDKIRFHFLFDDGHSKEIAKPSENIINKDFFSKQISLEIYSRNVTGIVCEGWLKSSGESLNTTLPLYILEGRVPKILNERSGSIISYKDGISLSCNVSGSEINLRWFRNDKLLEPTESSEKDGIHISTVRLSADPDWESNYTCIAKNQFGTATYTYRVIRPNNFGLINPERYKNLVLVLFIILGGFVLLGICVILNCQVTFKPRKCFSNQKKNDNPHKGKVEN